MDHNHLKIDMPKKNRNKKDLLIKNYKIIKENEDGK